MKKARFSIRFFFFTPSQLLLKLFVNYFWKSLHDTMSTSDLQEQQETTVQDGHSRDMTLSLISHGTTLPPETIDVIITKYLEFRFGWKKPTNEKTRWLLMYLSADCPENNSVFFPVADLTSSYILLHWHQMISTPRQQPLVDINFRDGNGRSALWFAVDRARSGHCITTQNRWIDLCRLLLQHGAHPDQEDEHGVNPLRHLVASFRPLRNTNIETDGLVRLCQMLIQNGANVVGQIDCLMEEAAVSRYGRIVTEILFPYASRENIKTALDNFVWNYSFDTVRELVSLVPDKGHPEVQQMFGSSMIYLSRNFLEPSDPFGTRLYKVTQDDITKAKDLILYLLQVCNADYRVLECDEFLGDEWGLLHNLVRSIAVESEEVLNWLLNPRITAESGFDLGSPISRVL